MSGRRLLPLCALALLAGACTRVVDAVIPTGAGMVCSQQSNDPACAPTPWPTPDGMHTANSDPWLVTHNQVITAMKPRVLVLNFDAAQNMGQTTDYVNQIIAALGAGSTYHGYADSSVPPFLTYQVAKIVDLTSVPPPVASGSPYLLDPTALFNDPRFPPLYGYPDSSGGYFSLCDLFEKGMVNEVWIQDGGDAQTTPRAPLYAERKQIYGDDGFAVPGSFEKTIGGFIGGAVADFALSVSCKVTVRLSHLDPSPNGGPGCDVMVRGWGIEGMWSALPSSLAADAYAFLNHDFNKFGLSGPGWPEICGGAAPCVSYPGLTHATSASMAPVSFDVPNFLQGCGNTLFPPNAIQSYDFENSTNQVDSRCGGFGLGGGPNGDVYAPYVADQTITTYDQLYTGNSRSCPAGWQVYWRQSMPGYQNQAKVIADGSPMPNWWPMLFY